MVLPGQVKWSSISIVDESFSKRHIRRSSSKIRRDCQVALYSSIASCLYPSRGQEHLPDRFLHVRLPPVVEGLVRPIG
jgi:hypothetical protein